MADNKNKNHDGHRDRMRKKFLKTGFDGFEEHEILELVLYYAVARKDTNDLAHELINKFKSFKGVCDADINELIKFNLITPTNAVLLKMIPQLAKVYTASEKKQITLGTTTAMCNYFISKFLGDTVEKVRLVCLNKKLELVNETVIADGSPGKVNFDIRRIAEFTYRNKCEDIVIAHNHPNGDALPSGEDVRSTREIYRILKPVGITLLDHIIVSGDNAYSLKDSGGFSML